MQNKKLILILIVVLLFGLCTLTILLGLGGTLLYTRAARLSKTEVFETVFPPLPTETIEEPPPTTALATATSIPTSSPSPAIPTVEPTPNIDFNGIRFYLDLQIAQGVLPELVPASTGNETDFFPASVYPEYTQFTLQGYVLKDTFHTPRLYVYPLQEYRVLDRAAGEMGDRLLLLIQDRPESPEEFPFLPLWNAAPLFHSNLRYLPFKNGSGLRYLTQFAQDVLPINNYDLFYTYQGITADQRWYVAAVLPVNHPALPNRIEDADWEISDPESYYAQIEAQLSAEADESFIPPLSLLDALIASLRIW